jgi:hypothetical protein
MIFSIAILGTLFSTHIVSPTYPVLVKWSGNGFVPPEYRVNKTCKIYIDRVVMTERRATTETTETKPFQFKNKKENLMTLVYRCPKSQ